MPQTLVAFWSAHWFSGSLPAGTTEQVPLEPVRLQAMQVPLQALLQQTPCAQKPELHIAAAVHGWPMASLPQLVPTQDAGEVQSVLDAQVVRQALLLPQA